MGLLFILSEEDAKMTKQFFISAYLGNYEKMYDLIIPYSKMPENMNIRFKEDVKKYCNEIDTKELTYYFTDMINICIKYEIVPPNYLFRMAKAFVCLNGINAFSNNLTVAKELLKEQVIEFFINRNLKDYKDIIEDSIKFVPEIVESTYKYGLVKGLAKQMVQVESLYKDLEKTFKNYKEMITLITDNYNMEY